MSALSIRDRAVEVALVISLTLNILVGANWLLRGDEPIGPGKNAAAGSEGGVGSAKAPTSTGELVSDLARLRSSGLSDEDTMPIMLKKVMSAAEGTIPAGGRYWETGWILAADADPAVRSAIETEARKTLLSLYGPAAEDAAALATIFRPLQREYPFLSAGEQRTVMAVRLRRIGRPNLIGGALPPGAISSDLIVSAAGLQASPAPDAELAFLNDLATALPGDKARAVAMRESSLAHQIRNANAKLTEEQFGNAYDTVVAARRRQRPISLADLQRGVGQRPALAILAQFDPAWPRLATTARSLGLSDDMLMEAYSVAAESSDAIAGRLASGAINVGTTKFVSETIARRDERIRGLVGAEFTPQLLSALNASGTTALPPGMRPLQAPQTGGPYR